MPECPAVPCCALPTVEQAARAWAEPAAPQGDAPASPPVLAAPRAMALPLNVPERGGGGHSHAHALPAGLTRRSWWCTRCS